MRGVQSADGIVVIGIDEDTFSELHTTWPLNRRRHAEMIDHLHRARVRQIVYDMQFTEPSPDLRADLALFKAAGRAGHVIFATGESDGDGRTRVLSGPKNLAEIGAIAAASNFPTDENGVVRHYERAVAGLPTIANATAAAVAFRHRPRSSDRETAWIDFRGPPGTFESYSFSDVLQGRVPDAALRGRIVIVGGTAPVLQDLHPTAASSEQLMPGPELQANAILTAMLGDPLRSAPDWLVWVVVAVLAFACPAVAVFGGPLRAVVASVVLGAVYVATAQAAFNHGMVVAVAAPLATLVAGMSTGLVARAKGEATGRRRAGRRHREVEAAGRERTADLAAAQLEMAMRLARAAELRDDDTGDHLERMSRLCERVGRELGMTAHDAELLRHASVLHDVGKIGLPDHILLKPGPLDEDELEQMRGHAAEGARLLDGSQSELLRVAEAIARTHHERWDGGGYPAGLVGAEIPLPGRIAAVCDVFDALTSPRPYKRAWTVDEACDEIARQRGKHFDPEVANALLRVVRSFPPPGPSVDAGAQRDVVVGPQQDDAAVAV